MKSVTKTVKRDVEVCRGPVGQHVPTCAGSFGHPFETIVMVCLINHVSLPKQVRCEYHERDAFCSCKGCENASTRDRGRRRESSPMPLWKGRGTQRS